MEFECSDSDNSNVKSRLKQNKILERDLANKAIVNVSIVSMEAFLYTVVGVNRYH